MIRTKSLYDACHAQFARFPLAASDLNDSGTVRSMILMVQDGDDPGFFVLARSDITGSYSLWPWPAGDIVDIEDDSRAAVPDMAVHAVTCGVPIPRDGSVFGWRRGASVSALIVVYSSYTLASPVPNWAVMPLAGIPETQWPPFTGEDLFGHWSWDYYQTGSIVSLAGLVAGTTDTVFWADTEAALGSNCCVVARDVTSPDGYTLPQGRYVYYQVLLARKPVPPLSALLTDAVRLDLAPRLRPLARSDPGAPG